MEFWGHAGTSLAGTGSGNGLGTTTEDGGADSLDVTAQTDSSTLTWSFCRLRSIKVSSVEAFIVAATQNNKYVVYINTNVIPI